MEVNILERDKEKMKIEVKGESFTLTQLLAKTLWQQGAEAATLKEHPVLEQPKIIVKASNPKKALEKAASSIEDMCEELKKDFKSALKK